MSSSPGGGEGKAVRTTWEVWVTGPELLLGHRRLCHSRSLFKVFGAFFRLEIPGSLT